MNKNPQPKLKDFQIIIKDKESGTVLVDETFNTGIVSFNKTSVEDQSFQVDIRVFGNKEPVIATLNALINRIDAVTPLVAFINKVTGRLPIFDLLANHKNHTKEA